MQSGQPVTIYVSAWGLWVWDRRLDAIDYGKQPTAPPRQGRYYRLQVGSFSVPGNATRAANSLRELGLNPAFEEFRDNIRVVLSRIPGEDVVETARKAGSAGFSEIWCREEP